ncbi:MAG: FMN-binding protein [Spirochaetaceae bacterium]|nr:FMN-binding protein [Spirochaetaceae bacterium]
MKKYVLLIACALLGLAACLSFNKFAVYEAGNWEGSGTGYNGLIRVVVETDASSIIDINVLEHNEDMLVGGEAIRDLKELVLETDSTDIDAISGATQTCEGFIYAVDNALSKARIKK